MTSYTGVASTSGFTLYLEDRLVCHVSETGVRVRPSKRQWLPLFMAIFVAPVLAGLVGAALHAQLPKDLALPHPAWILGLLVGLLLLFLYSPAGARLRRWHGAEHQTLGAVEKILDNPQLTPEEAFAASSHLHPYCGTVLLGMFLPLLPLAFLSPLLAVAALALVAYLHERLPADHALRTPGLLLQRLLTAPVQEESTRCIEALYALKHQGFFEHH